MFGVGMLLAKIAKSTHGRTHAGHEKIEGPTQGAPKGAIKTLGRIMDHLVLTFVSSKIEGPPSPGVILLLTIIQG